jgi:hypothetical protein
MPTSLTLSSFTLPSVVCIHDHVSAIVAANGRHNRPAVAAAAALTRQTPGKVRHIGIADHWRTLSTRGPRRDRGRAGVGQAAGTAALAGQAGVPQLAASSLKAALDVDWDDRAARDLALAQVLSLVDQVEAFVAAQYGNAAAAAATAAARQVRDQDVDCSDPVPTLRRGVARDRRISVEDPQIRHGRKSRSVLFDGYKRHVLADLDTGLVPPMGITPATAPEAAAPATSPPTWTPPDGTCPSCTSTGPTWPRYWSATADRTWPSSARPGRSATPAAGSPRTSSPWTSPPGS